MSKAENEKIQEIGSARKETKKQNRGGHLVDEDDERHDASEDDGRPRLLVQVDGDITEIRRTLLGRLDFHDVADLVCTDGILEHKARVKVTRRMESARLVRQLEKKK